MASKIKNINHKKLHFFNWKMVFIQKTSWSLGGTKPIMLVIKKNRKISFTRPGPQARPSHCIDMCVCVCVCLHACLCVCPPKDWTFRYLLDTLDLKVPFGYLRPLGTFWIPCTFKYLLDTLNLQVPFGYFGPYGTFWITWTFRYLLDTLDISVHLGPLVTSQFFRYLQTQQTNTMATFKY